MKKILLITGDFSEDYGVMVPRQAPNMLGLRVDVVCPGKHTGKFIKTVIHDPEDDQTYAEKPGHLFRLTISFDDIRLQEYGGVYISGGRSLEYLRSNRSVLDIVYYAMNLTLPVAATCHSPQILVAAGILKDRKLMGHFMVKSEVEMTGDQWVTAADDEITVDGNLITATTWMRHPAILRHFIIQMGTSVIH